MGETQVELHPFINHVDLYREKLITESDYHIACTARTANCVDLFTLPLYRMQLLEVVNKLYDIYPGNFTLTPTEKIGSINYYTPPAPHIIFHPYLGVGDENKPPRPTINDISLPSHPISKTRSCTLL